MTTVAWQDFQVGDLVAWENDDGEMVRGKVAQTPREEPWLAYGRTYVLVHGGVDPSCERSFTHREPHELQKVRCLCCDGPDGLGVHHVRRLTGLREFLRQHPDTDGPFVVEDGRGRAMLEAADRAEAEAILDDWDAETALDGRDYRNRGTRVA